MLILCTKSVWNSILLLEKATWQFVLIQIHPGNTVHPQGLICESSGFHKKKKKHYSEKNQWNHDCNRIFLKGSSSQRLEVGDP
jgi:hypothetical protein